MRTLTVTVQHEIGEIVYHRTTDEPVRGMVTGISIRPQGILYEVIWNGCETNMHYGCELSVNFIPDYEHKLSEQEDET